MRRYLRTGVVGWVLLLVVWGPSYAIDTPAIEQKKIELLIEQVERLTDAVFIRNDQAYDAKTAAQFMRDTWEAHAGTIRTAPAFIAHVAGGSSPSSLPARIRFTDGREITSEAYLREELKRLEQ